jgi:hypothetical protein
MGWVGDTFKGSQAAKMIKSNNKLIFFIVRN